MFGQFFQPPRSIHISVNFVLGTLAGLATAPLDRALSISGMSPWEKNSYTTIFANIITWGTYKTCDDDIDAALSMAAGFWAGWAIGQSVFPVADYVNTSAPGARI